MKPSKYDEKKPERPPQRATGSQLRALVMNYRRRGMTASFGVDLDPHKRQQS